MKIHLPLFLRTALLAACVVVGMNSYTMAADPENPDAGQTDQGGATDPDEEDDTEEPEPLPKPEETWIIGSGESRSLDSEGGTPYEVNITLDGGDLSVVNKRQTITGDLTLNSGTIDLSAGYFLIVDSLIVNGEIQIILSDEDLDMLISSDNADDGLGITLFIAKHDTGDDVDTSLFKFSEKLDNYRHTVENDDGEYVLKMDSQDLTWKRGESGTINWGLKEAGGVWDVAGDTGDEPKYDHHYYDRDRVTISTTASQDADVNLTTDVNPGKITVSGAGHTTISSEDGYGIKGKGVLEKSGSGTLTIETDNSEWEGKITVSNGKLEVRNENALGSGDVEFRRGELDAGGYTIENKVTVGGNNNACTLTDADGLKNLVFSGGTSSSNTKEVNGEYTLREENTLTITQNKTAFKGDFTFAGGTMKFNGANLLTFDTGSLDPGNDGDDDDDDDGGDSGGTGDGGDGGGDGGGGDIPPVDIKHVGFASSSSPTHIDVTGMEKKVWYNSRYTLITFTGDGIDIDLDDLDIDSLFTLDEYDEALYKRSHLELTEDGRGNLLLELVIDELLEDPNVAAALTRDEHKAYSAFIALAGGSAGARITGALAQYLNQLILTDSPAEARKLISQLGGLQLVSMMSTQIAGNMAHLRRLRTHVGTAQSLRRMENMTGLAAAYVSAFTDDQRQKRNTTGDGWRRTEVGGSVGVETHVSERTLIGVGLSDGWASVTSDGALSSKYRESSTWLDWYMLKNFGRAWRSVTTFGIGMHSYDITRRLPDGLTATADRVTGRAINFSQEFSYNIRRSDYTSFQPVFMIQSSINEIKDFTESGAGTASLSAKKREAWATDITMAVRLVHNFAALQNAPFATLTVQAGVTASVGDTCSDLTLSFLGAPATSFTLRGARHDRVGGHVNVNVSLPIARDRAIFGGVGAIMRGDMNELDATVGIRFNF